jgi:Ca-activated chloride channel family protein
MVQLAIEYHRVSVTIEDQVAVTRVDQVFRNDNDWTVEGTYVFPLPPGAAVSRFTLWIDGEPVEGEILTREEARAIYEEIVRSMRDPALLEYIDQGAVQASVFPIPPGGKRRIQLEYTQVLTADNGLFHYRYPLNTEKFSTLPLEEVSISVHLQSGQPIRTVYSPSHEVEIVREGDYELRVSYEAFDVKPDRDFDLYYSVAQDLIGLNLLSFRDPFSEEDGFFLLLAAPSVEVDPEQRVAKDILFVLDKSGSMEGEKFRQAQEALHYVLDHMNPEDRFNIIAFSTGLQTFAGSLQPSTQRGEAKEWVDRLAPRGATDINRALLEALAMVERGRPTILIFLTDGLPTEGVTETAAILQNVARQAPDNLRLFAFGVGYDVDTFLLDTLSKENHGATTYVTPDQDISEQVSAFFAKVNDPVLTDVQVDFGDVVVYDIYPDPLPDIFAGSQLVVVGRYRSSGTVTVRLEGEVEGRRQTFEYPEQAFRSRGGPDFLPRLWATRKIGALLSEIRLNGPEKELVDQLVKLSIRYGIITPYTSFLVTEPQALGAEAQRDIAEEAWQAFAATPAPPSGREAVERAMGEAELDKAHAPAALPQESAQIVRLAGKGTFRLVEGVWTDTRFDPQRMTPIRVPFLSQAYFELASASPEAAAAFALGERVIVVIGERAYQVVGEEDQGDPLQLPPAEPEEDSDSLVGPPEEPMLVDRALQPGQGGGGIPLCGALGLGLAALWLPIERRKKR